VSLSVLAAVRQLVDSTQQRLSERIGSLGQLAVTANEQPQPCPRCLGVMKVQKTSTHLGMTIEHGSFAARETVHVCAQRCRWPSGALVTHRAASLIERLMPNSGIGYDVMVFVGLQRFLHHRQRDEIRAALQKRHGLRISTGEVSRLNNAFLAYLQRLHDDRAPAIRAALESDGGWPLHLDATGEDGRGTLLTIFAGWRQWVLGAWKIPTEHAEAIIPHLRSTVALFGLPCAIMRDLGHAVTSAVETLLDELKVKLPVLACHQHFLRDVGKDLLDADYKQLQALFRRFKTCTALRALARDLGRKLGTGINDARAAVTQWQSTPDECPNLPESAAGLATIRAVAQWVLDYPSDGSDHGVPFDRPYLDLFERCAQASQAADAWLVCPPQDRRVRSALVRLHTTLSPTVREVPFVRLASTLARRAELFDELRTALRLTPKHGRNEVVATRPRATGDAVAELRDVRKAVEKLTASLRNRRPQRGPAQDIRRAIDLVLRHIDTHGDHLWGHVISLPEKAGGGVRLVDRTNNVLEGFFHGLKHAERRRSGRKILTQDLENLPAAAALARNLIRSDYVEVLCGSLVELPRAFAKLDARARELALLAAKGKDENNCKHTSRAPRPSTPASSQQPATASMPKDDRAIIRTDAMRQRVLAAARIHPPRGAGVPPALKATGS